MKLPEPLILTLDAGTTGVKCAVFRKDAASVFSRTEDYPTLYPHPGWAQQRPGDILDAAVRAIRTALEAVPPGDIAALVFTGTMNGCIPLDESGNETNWRVEAEKTFLALLEEQFDHIFYTGGVRVGQMVLDKAAQHLTPVTLELGGKSPCIVDNTASISLAARRIAFGKALNAGQTCVAPDYLLVHESVANRLLNGIKNAWEHFYGDALQNPQWPRMINERHYQRVMDLMAGEQVDAAAVRCGIAAADVCKL